MAERPVEKTTQERFFKYFQNELIALQDQMSRLGDKALIGGERRDATDHCLAGITRLSSEVKDVSASLPSYDVRTYSEAIKALQEKLAETQAAFAPKPKFSFKTKKNASAISLNDAAELAAQRRSHVTGASPPDRSTESSSAATPVYLDTPPNEKAINREATIVNARITHHRTADSGPTTNDGRTPEALDRLDPARGSPMTEVSSQTSSYIVIPSSASHAQAPCMLTKLRKCCVDLSAPTADSAPFVTLTINDVQESLLLSGIVTGPAHITGVRDSTIVISCRQFRMHSCENVVVYLNCTSRPIIEDCTNIRFSKLPDIYHNLLFRSNDESHTTNLWDQVDDFKWLRAEQSPNWSILSEAEQIPDSTWQNVLHSKVDRNVNDILSAVHHQGRSTTSQVS